MTVTATPKAKLKYYSWNKLLGYNASWNFLVGARGLGKTYGCKKIVLRAAIKNGEQFIYLRRYKEELKASRDAFFDDIGDQFPDYDFRINSKYAEMSHIKHRTKKSREWTVIGHFIALSQAQGVKSVSYSKVTRIIFDEFIIEKGMTRYLPNEAEAFTNFFSTVDRYKDKTKVFFLANSVSIMNPYFLAYNIRPKEGDQWISMAEGFICVHLADSKEFESGVYQTKFGKFIKDSDYASYAVGSEFRDNNDNLLEQKTNNAVYAYTLETGEGTFSVWLDRTSTNIYIQERLPKSQVILTMDAARMAEGKELVFYNDKRLQFVRSAFKQGSAYFDSSKARNAFTVIFKR